MAPPTGVQDEIILIALATSLTRLASAQVRKAATDADQYKIDGKRADSESQKSQKSLKNAV